MTLRELIESILNKHAFYYVNPGNAYISEEQIKTNRAAFIADLCAVVEEARPEPSREAVETLLFDTLSTTTTREGSAWWDGVKTDGRAKRLVDGLMAWARGDARRPKAWCEHMRYHEQTHLWVYLTTLHSADLWKFCPSCAAPRPMEPN